MMSSGGSASTNPNTQIASTAPDPSAYYSSYDQPEQFRYEEPENLENVGSGRAHKKSNTWQY